MNYYFDNTRIEPCYLVNDIGVDIDSLLHFDKHNIDLIVAKTYSCLMEYYLEALFLKISTLKDKLIFLYQTSYRI